ncbi:MAG: hypothetical protein K2K00_08560 [Muribaculaceae bacterium]|nr:hypothetical protein [Muribaculaceae bacterium]
MADWHSPQGPFDIPDVPNYVPRRLKPWLFIFFVIIIQFSGGVYLAAATDMVGSTAMMQEDILMAGYASLIGMSINFAVMFRFKFRFSNRTQLLTAGTVLIAANLICAHTESPAVLAVTCLVAGWFRMQATLACNSTIQLWLTPVRDMSVFFCYVYLLVDSAIQLCGIATVYTAFNVEWEYMQWIMCGLLALMMLMVIIFVKPVRGPMFIPLLGIDWIGAILWAGFMMAFTFVCVYGNFYDWWEATEIRQATVLGCLCLAVNLWRATFLHHPYISFRAMMNHNVIRATVIYMVFFTLMATEHVFEHSYAANILGFDETNLIDLNWYVFVGILAGCGFTYATFALRKWRYKTMTAIAFALAAVYLAYFYFLIDYGVEKEMLFVPLFVRGAASVIISIVYLTSIVQSGLPFQVYPQALTINGFTGAVMGATFGPAIIGEFLRHTMVKNASLLSAPLTDFNAEAAYMPLGQLYGMVQQQALVVSMKEIYGWLLIAAIISLIIIALSYGPIKPHAIFPKWRTVRKVLRSLTIG